MDVENVAKNNSDRVEKREALKQKDKRKNDSGEQFYCTYFDC